MFPGAKRDSSKRAQIIERCRDATGRRRPRTRIAPEKLAYYGVARPTLSENEFQKKPPVRSASLLERRGFEPPVLFGLFHFGEGSKSGSFRPEFTGRSLRETIL